MSQFYEPRVMDDRTATCHVGRGLLRPNLNMACIIGSCVSMRLHPTACAAMNGFRTLNSAETCHAMRLRGRSHVSSGRNPRVASCMPVACVQ